MVADIIHRVMVDIIEVGMVPAIVAVTMLIIEPTTPTADTKDVKQPCTT